MFFNEIFSNAFNKTPFYYLAEKGNLEIVNYLINIDGIDINYPCVFIIFS